MSRTVSVLWVVGGALLGCQAPPATVRDAVVEFTDQSRATRYQLRGEHGAEQEVVDLGGGGRHVLLGRISVDGGLERQCVSSVEEAERFVRGEAVPRHHEERVEWVEQ